MRKLALLSVLLLLSICACFNYTMATMPQDRLATMLPDTYSESCSANIGSDTATASEVTTTPLLQDTHRLHSLLLLSLNGLILPNPLCIKLPRPLLQDIHPLHSLLLLSLNGLILPNPLCIKLPRPLLQDIHPLHSLLLLSLNGLILPNPLCIKRLLPLLQDIHPLHSLLPLSLNGLILHPRPLLRISTRSTHCYCSR